jgi:hypothetical protein
VDKKWVIPLASAVPILAILYAFSLGPSPHKVLRDFETSQAPESMLMQPLLDADAAEVAPIVISGVADKKMPRRRYAIGYLGQIKSAPALPVLEQILADSSEEGHLRADALEAISSIDRARAHQLAVAHRDSPDELGRLARDLLAEKAGAVVGALQ